MRTLPTDDVMYDALVRRDDSFDGLFVVGVKTTGIFCRPTCSARKPRRQNVEFFADPRQALHAGYRACKVCRPVGGAAEATPDWVDRLLREVEREPSARMTDERLRAMSIQPARARRYFKRHFGMTFHAYGRARRLGGALARVRAGTDMTRAGFESGFESASGFRDAFTRLFGAPPRRLNGRSRSNGSLSPTTAECLVAKWIDTPLGAMVAAASERGLCLLEFVDRRAIEAQVASVRERFRCSIVPGTNEHLDGAVKELEDYFDGKPLKFRTALDLRGTEFQVAAWKRLLQIPYGETLSYSRMAQDIGRPGAQRAVGRANGDNRIAIIVPCHRVVRADGSLCGYGGGLWRKRWMLEHEGAATRTASPAAIAGSQSS